MTYQCSDLHGVQWQMAWAADHRMPRPFQLMSSMWPASSSGQSYEASGVWLEGLASPECGDRPWTGTDQAVIVQMTASCVLER